MSYFQQLVTERKARLKRLNVGPRKEVSCESKNTQSETVPEVPLVPDLQAEVTRLAEQITPIQQSEAARQLEAARCIKPQDRNEPSTKEPPPVPRPSVHRIKQAVAAHYGITLIEVDALRRTAAICRPRQVAIYLACRLTLRSLPFIGRQFAGRDHTTILHSRNKIERLRKTDADLDAELLALEAKITA